MLKATVTICQYETQCSSLKAELSHLLNCSMFWCVAKGVPKQFLDAPLIFYAFSQLLRVSGKHFSSYFLYACFDKHLDCQFNFEISIKVHNLLIQIT